MTRTRILLTPYTPGLITPADLKSFTTTYDTPIWNEPTFPALLAHLEAYRAKEPFLVNAGDRTVGLFALLPFPEAGTYAQETFLYLHPDARRHGIARTLLLTAARTAATLQIDLYGDVRTDNIASTGLHEELFRGTPTTTHTSPHGYQTRRWLTSAITDSAQSNPASRALTTTLGFALQRLDTLLHNPARLDPPKPATAATKPKRKTRYT